MKTSSKSLICIFALMMGCKQRSNSTVESANIGDSSETFLSGLGIYDYDVIDGTDPTRKTPLKINSPSAEYFSDADEARTIKSETIGDSLLFDKNFGDDKKLGFFLYFDFTDKNLAAKVFEKGNADDKPAYSTKFWIVNDQSDALKGVWPNFYGRYKEYREAQTHGGKPGIKITDFYDDVRSFVNGRFKTDSKGIVNTIPPQRIFYPTPADAIDNKKNFTVPDEAPTSGTPANTNIAPESDMNLTKDSQTASTDLATIAAGMHILIKDFTSTELNDYIIQASLPYTGKTENIYLVSVVSNENNGIFDNASIGIHILKVASIDHWTDPNQPLDAPTPAAGSEAKPAEPELAPSPAPVSTEPLDCATANSGNPQTFTLKEKVWQIAIHSKPGSRKKIIASKTDTFEGILECNKAPGSRRCWFRTSVTIKGEEVPGFFNSKLVHPSPARGCDPNTSSTAK